MGTAANVRVGVTGEVYMAASATALPGDATTVPGVGFDQLGFLSDDGVLQTIDRTTSDITAWGGDVVRTIQTAHDVTYTMTFIETSPEVLKVYYSDDDAVLTLVEVKSDQAPRKTMVIDVLDGAEVIRLELPDCQVTDTGDVIFATEEAIAYEVTVTAYPDTNGVKVFIRQATV